MEWVISMDQDKDNYIALLKIGASRRAHMAWVISMAQKNPQKMTAPDWSNFRLEIAAFCMFIQSSTQVSEITIESNDMENTSHLTELEAQCILKIFRSAIENAFHHKSISFGEIHKKLVLNWSTAKKGYVRSAFPCRNWVDHAKDCLDSLIVEFGHLLKICPAPKPWGRGELCSTLFLARRPNQVYCSSNCQNRETTRASRIRGA